MSVNDKEELIDELSERLDCLQHMGINVNDQIIKIREWKESNECTENYRA